MLSDCALVGLDRASQHSLLYIKYIFFQVIAMWSEGWELLERREVNKKELSALELSWWSPWQWFINMDKENPGGCSREKGAVTRNQAKKELDGEDMIFWSYIF